MTSSPTGPSASDASDGRFRDRAGASAPRRAVRVARRAVFHVGGYERNDWRAFHARLVKELERFRACWSVSAELGPVSQESAGVTAAPVHYRDAGGETRTDLFFMDYDDVVAAEAARALPVRLMLYLAAFVDYVVSGTVFRFFRANFRFGLFFLYPFLGLVLPPLLGILVWDGARGLPFPGAGIAALGLGLAVAVVPVWLLGRRFFLFHLMGLWTCGSALLRGRHEVLDRRLSAWAGIVDEKLACDTYDEVAFLGHSLGGGLVLDLCARHARRVAERGGEPRFCVMTVGSTGPMLTMHPAGSGPRNDLACLASHPGIVWADVQSLTDPINFYRCDAMALAGLSHDRADAFPYISQIRVRAMVDGDIHRRMKWNLFRVHYQFVSANTKRYRYDWPMMCFGSLPVAAVLDGTIALQDFEPSLEGDRTAPRR